MKSPTPKSAGPYADTSAFISPELFILGKLVLFACLIFGLEFGYNVSE